VPISSTGVLRYGLPYPHDGNGRWWICDLQCKLLSVTQRNLRPSWLPQIAPPFPAIRKREKFAASRTTTTTTTTITITETIISIRYRQTPMASEESRHKATWTSMQQMGRQHCCWPIACFPIITFPLLEEDRRNLKTQAAYVFIVNPISRSRRCFRPDGLALT
jgi:hypothetical protein